MITERLQSLLDREVAGSPRARELLALLEGRSLDIEARHTPWRVQLQASAGRLLLERNAAVAGTARIVASPLSLLALVREDPQDVIRRGDAVIDGDGQVAGRFQELLALLRPDLEEELSRLVGDIPAHGIGRLARALFSFGADAGRTVAQNFGEYFAHERRELVTRAEAGDFLSGVDQLRERTDRVAARVDALRARGTA